MQQQKQISVAVQQYMHTASLRPDSTEKRLPIKTKSSSKPAKSKKQSMTSKHQSNAVFKQNRYKLMLETIND